MAIEALKSRRRNDYKFQLEYRTRCFDSIVNTYLIQHCSLYPPTSSQIGLVVHSHCDYLAPIEFPAVVDLALRVNKLGKSSVTYEIAVFQNGEEEVKAVGEFVHVFVDRDSRRPAKEGMNEELKGGLESFMSVSAIQGPGILFVRSRISPASENILDEPTFLRWYDDEHIPEVVSTSGIRSASRYIDVNKTSPTGDVQNLKPFLTFYPMQNLDFTLSDEFKKISVQSSILPDSGIIYDFADMDVSYLGFLGATPRKDGDVGANIHSLSITTLHSYTALQAPLRKNKRTIPRSQRSTNYR
ncbi:hypothetical protein CFE70_003353 [Pyrenophora teres f. teres 0-1]